AARFDGDVECRLVDAGRGDDALRQRRQVRDGSLDRHPPRLESADVEQAVGHATQGFYAGDRCLDVLDILAREVPTQRLEVRDENLHWRSHIADDHVHGVDV